MPVLVLITRIIHQFKIHFAVARSIVYLVIHGKKLDSRNNIIKFVEKSHYLKQRGRKVFVFLPSKFASKSNNFVHAFIYIFFSVS